ncbi:MAG TPA: RluA family pseudouridine synthase [Synergistaceae bacterium]|nr:RluA family pseudouridine synthase [Synergistaceae bacterium]
MTERNTPEEDVSFGGEEEQGGASTDVLTVTDRDQGVRLDVFVATSLGITRSYARKLIDGGQVRLESGAPARAGRPVPCGTVVTVHLPPPEALDLEPEDVPFTVLYEDPWVIVVDKPAGVVVHPAPGNWHGTLVHGLLYRFREFSAFNGTTRPGIVHRLDGPTSGLLVVARTPEALQNLQDQFRRREVEKRYLALVQGRPSPAVGVVDLPIGRSPTNRVRMAVSAHGRDAWTEYRTLWALPKFSFLECRIATGRTHQIRVHLAHLGHPIVGDALYGADKRQAAELGRLFLHSWRLSFAHPETDKPMSFTSALPGPLIELLRDILSRARAGR